MPTLSGLWEGNTVFGEIGERNTDTAESKTLCMYGNSKRENREIPSVSAKCGTVRKHHVWTADMNADGKSDESVVPATLANNGSAEELTESVEERDSAKRNVEQPASDRTQSRDQPRPRGLHGVREAARKDSQLQFTALLHHVSEEALLESFYALKRNVAVGVDHVTWHEYERDVENRIADLEPIEQSLLDVSGYPNRTGDNAHSVSPRWKIRSFSKRCCGYCSAFMSKTFSVSVMVSDEVAASIKPLMP